MDLPQLESDSTYCARVRVKPLPNYYGPWSEWSNEYTWTTDWGMSLSHHHTPGTAPLHREREAREPLSPVGIPGDWHLVYYRHCKRDLGKLRPRLLFIGHMAFLAFVSAMIG